MTEVKERSVDLKKTRIFGPDLVRAVAVTFVLAVHFFLYTGFYDVPLQGGSMFVATAVRMSLMTCVPLFLMLSGYLCIHKTWSTSYYRGIISTLILYVLSCLCCLSFRQFIVNEDLSQLGWIGRIFAFTAAPYSWYVEMYIGLFLLIPFFNAAWNNIGEKAKVALLITLIFLSSLPNVVNMKKIILPDFWLDIYPLCYYAIGAWLREHPLKVNKLWLVLGWIAASFISAFFHFDFFEGGLFGVAKSSNRGSFLVLVETVMLFSALMGVKGDKVPKPLKWSIISLAKLSFPVYLLSYIGDTLIYPVLCERIPIFGLRAFWILPCLIVNLVLSCILAQILEWICSAIMKLIPEGGKKQSAQQ